MKPILLALLVCLPTPAQITDRQAVEAIIGESASEPFQSKLAIAGALRNRNSLAGVRGYRNQSMIQRQPARIWSDANRAWAQSKTNDLSHGACFWESSNFPTPPWSTHMTHTATVGKFNFFNPTTHQTDPPRSPRSPQQPITPPTNQQHPN